MIRCADKTSSPSEVNVEQAWLFLAVIRSGKEPRKLPSELYLGKEQEDDYNGNFHHYLHLSTFPKLIVTRVVGLQTTVQLCNPRCGTENCLPPVKTHDDYVSMFYRLYVIVLTSMVVVPGNGITIVLNIHLRPLMSGRHGEAIPSGHD